MASGSRPEPCNTGLAGPSTRPVSTATFPGALVHGPRHTFATELANANVGVYTLMKLLGQESMVTSQRYVDGADTRSAAEQNPLYDLLTVTDNGRLAHC
jgi:integrase